MKRKRTLVIVTAILVSGVLGSCNPEGEFLNDISERKKRQDLQTIIIEDLST